MTKVILADSPSWQLFDPSLMLHLGILYLAGSLREAGHDVHVIDCHAVTSWDESRGGLVVHQDLLEPCDVLGLSTTTANLKWGCELAQAWPAKVKVLGGPHVTHIVEGPHKQYLAPRYFSGFDYLMYEEAEEAFVYFCDVIGRGDDAKQVRPSVPGLVWFGPFGPQVNQPPTKPDITKLPTPAFDLWGSGFKKGGLSGPTDKARSAGRKLTASIYSARGCPYLCHFCADARTKMREETLAQTEDQVNLLKTLGVGAIRIQDDTFTIKTWRAKAIADVLHRYGMDWRGTTRVNLVNPEVFEYLRDRGCTELGFGIEHGSDRMLKAMEKGTNSAKNEASLDACKQAGIVGRAFLMIGFPGETHETIDELRDWVLRVRPDAVTLSLFQPFPGSAVWDHPDRFGVRLPDAPFDKFWQLGGDNDPDCLVLDLPTISKADLFRRKRELVELFTREIAPLDRKKIDGNIGTFGPSVQDGGMTSGE